MKKFTVATYTALLTCLLSGCVTYATTKNEPRKNVRFGSAQAAQTFYDAYLVREYQHYHSTKAVSHSISIGLHPPYWQHKAITENIRFNRAVTMADTNHDGMISLAEAQAYAENVLPAGYAVRQ
jgi:hypothetical protein